MKVSWVLDESRAGYLYRLLAWLPERSGVEVAPPAEADLFLVSVDAPDDMPLVRRARKLAGERPVIAGGFESYAGEYLLAYCDGVCVGEGFEFFRELARAPDVDYLLSLPYVLTREAGLVRPSYEIPSAEIPLFRTGRNGWYYLAEKGCPQRCVFCMTAYIQEPWHNERANIDAALRHVEARHSRLTLIEILARRLPHLCGRGSAPLPFHT